MTVDKTIFSLLEQLFPINRSITGNGVRTTLCKLGEEIGKMNVTEVPSGTKVFDWTIPKEWHVSEAWIKCPDGKKICDFANNNLPRSFDFRPPGILPSLEWNTPRNVNFAAQTKKAHGLSNGLPALGLIFGGLGLSF